MNKEAKKTLEKEIITLIEQKLTTHNKLATIESKKSIKSMVKDLTKKFGKEVKKAEKKKKKLRKRAVKRTVKKSGARGRVRK